MGSKDNPPPSVRRPLSSDELADLDEQFDECDVDGDQRIDFIEFSQLLENLGCGSATAATARPIRCHRRGPRRSRRPA